MPFRKEFYCKNFLKIGFMKKRHHYFSNDAFKNYKNAYSAILLF